MLVSTRNLSRSVGQTEFIRGGVLGPQLRWKSLLHTVPALVAAVRLGETVSSLIFADDFFTEPLDEPGETCLRLTPSFCPLGTRVTLSLSLAVSATAGCREVMHCILHFHCSISQSCEAQRPRQVLNTGFTDGSKAPSPVRCPSPLPPRKGN